MTGDDARRAATEELELANEELLVAEQLVTGGHARIALARIYFAAFHAARARLYIEGLEPRSHSGVQYLWNSHMVKTQRYTPASSRLLARLQKYREEADYSRAFVVDSVGALAELEEARALVERIAADVGRT